MTTHVAHANPARGTLARPAYATLAVLLLAALVVAAIDLRTGYWHIAAFGLGPDLALLYGAAGGLEKGRLHPRAVASYNLLHRFFGPLVLATAASFGVISTAFLVGALAWAFHIALDRAVGYGLRTRDGYQRS